MSHTVCSVLVANHSRRIASANRLGWLHDEHSRAAERRMSSRAAVISACLRPIRRRLAAA